MHHPHRSTVVITPPTAEPCTVTEFMTQLGITAPTDPTQAQALSTQLLNLLLAAREDVENYTRRALMLQTRELRLDCFPFRDRRYGHARRWEHGHSILLPFAPLMAIVSFTFTDFEGNTCTVAYDSSYGTAENLPAWTYQRSLGTETLPGRLEPGRFRFWPWAGEGEDVVRIRFRCGYGGPVQVTTTAESAVIASPMVFTQDDVNRPICIPNAGAEGANNNPTTLVTSIASVDENGNATLTNPASAAVENVNANYGIKVPEPIRQAILILAQSYFNNGFGSDMPAFVAARLKPYCNWTS